MSINMKPLSPLDLLKFYEQGHFPMADSATDDAYYIVTPEQRSLLPIDLRVPRRLKRTVLKGEFEIRVNSAFSDVIDACGEIKTTRSRTWINVPIKELFNALHAMGHAHSVEAWKGGELAGGLYGLQVGAAFCGESMFSRATDASKVALVHLAARLKKTGFRLLDAQFESDHLAQFGQFVIPQEEFVMKLKDARRDRPDFANTGLPEAALVREFLSKPAP